MLEQLQGETFESAWPKLSSANKARIAEQTANYLLQLRKLQSPVMGNLEGKPIYATFLFLDGYGIPHGPLSTDTELWEVLSNVVRHIPEKARAALRARMPTATPFTFTHGDLATVNIMVKDGNLTGIIDWEAAGYFPAWWEYVAATIGQGNDDSDWKALLREHLPKYDGARKFWLYLHKLRKYPNLDNGGRAMLEQLLQG